MSNPQSNRRDFLKGKAAAEAVADVAHQAADAVAETIEAIWNVPIEESYLVKYSRRAMACEFEIWLNVGEYEQGGEVALAALDLVDELESQMTVYREDSEVSVLNRTAAAGPVAVEPRLFSLLARAVELHKLTDRAFDITAGRLSELWGFKRRSGRLPDADSIAETLSRAGTQHLHLDAEHRTVRFDCDGLEINLGAIGKGEALDRCAELFAAANVDNYLLHGGNSSVLGRGSQAAGPRDGWLIGVRNPLRPTERLGQLRLRNRALATSGSGTQYFMHEGQRYGHILDPRTGWPAQGVLSATVLAPTAAEADALSTACYVLGPAGAATLCEQNEAYACLLVCPGEAAGQLVVHPFNLMPDEWKLAENADR